MEKSKLSICMISVISVGTLLYASYKIIFQRKKKNLFQIGRWNYHEMKNLIKGYPLPTMIVDLDIYLENVRRLGKIAEKNGKKLRMATKSIRVPSLIDLVLKEGGKSFQGLMCFSVEECEKLYESYGYDDFLVAYPTVQESDLEITWSLRSKGVSVHLMIDSEAHVLLINQFWEKKTQHVDPSKQIKCKVCIDYDMSYRLLGGFIHLGAHRSPIHTLEDIKILVQFIQSQGNNLQLSGFMAYDAQVAGLPEINPFSPLMNPIKKLVKYLSIGQIVKKRKELGKWIKSQNLSIEIFNGGGTGSIRQTSSEEYLTEVTAGSGFLQSSLFDYYQDSSSECAFVFALQATRKGGKNLICCQSGGFIASGEISGDKAPVPFLPADLKEFPSEGFGEVQTPLQVPNGLEIKIGDPIFFRPSKAGEIAERFNEYLMKKGNSIVGRAKTYRGLGWNFF